MSASVVLDKYNQLKLVATKFLGHEFSVHDFNSMRTSDGLAFNALIYYKNRPVGYLENQGTGGPDHMSMRGSQYFETPYDIDVQQEANEHWQRVVAVLGANGVDKFYADEIIIDALLTKEGF